MNPQSYAKYSSGFNQSTQPDFTQWMPGQQNFGSAMQAQGGMQPLTAGGARGPMSSTPQQQQGYGQRVLGDMRASNAPGMQQPSPWQTMMEAQRPGFMQQQQQQQAAYGRARMGQQYGGQAGAFRQQTRGQMGTAQGWNQRQGFGARPNGTQPMPGQPTNAAMNYGLQGQAGYQDPNRPRAAV